MFQIATFYVFLFETFFAVVTVCPPCFVYLLFAAKMKSSFINSYQTSIQIQRRKMPQCLMMQIQTANELRLVDIAGTQMTRQIRHLPVHAASKIHNYQYTYISFIQDA